MDAATLNRIAYGASANRYGFSECPGCHTAPAYLTVPADPWDRHEVCPECRHCYSHGTCS